ncbi:unnamed protein product [Musa hybrid cultivar]
MLFLFSNISASEAARRTRVVQRRTWPSDGTKAQLLYTKEIVIHWNHCSSAETANPKQTVDASQPAFAFHIRNNPRPLSSGFLVFCKKIIPIRPFRCVE